MERAGKGGWGWRRCRDGASPLDLCRSGRPMPRSQPPLPARRDNGPLAQQTQAGERPWDSTPGRDKEGGRGGTPSGRAPLGPRCGLRAGASTGAITGSGMCKGRPARTSPAAGSGEAASPGRRRRKVQAAACSAGPPSGPNAQPTSGRLPCGFSLEPSWETGGGSPQGGDGDRGGTGKGRGGARPLQ